MQTAACCLTYKQVPPLLDESLKRDFERASLLVQNRNLDEAINILRKILAKNSRHAESQAKLVLCLESRGIAGYSRRDYESAERDFSEALKLAPDKTTESRLRKFLEMTRGLMRTSP